MIRKVLLALVLGLAFLGGELLNEADVRVRRAQLATRRAIERALRRL